MLFNDDLFYFPDPFVNLSIQKVDLKKKNLQKVIQNITEGDLANIKKETDHSVYYKH